MLRNFVSGSLKILMIGDVLGSSGRKSLADHLPRLRAEHQLDLVIANAENSAHGFGLTPSIAKELFKYGVDVLTGGNHTWDKREVIQAMQEFPKQIIRPANYPRQSPGVGWTVVLGKSGHKIGVVNLMGRIFMDPLDCPFHTFQEIIEPLRAQTKIIFVDFHGEASSEKQAFGWYVDGKVTAIVGTHTHVQTADERILPQGTGYMTDLGMTGDLNSVIGMKKEIILERFLKKMPLKIEPAEGPGTLHGAVFTIDPYEGKCLSIQRIKQE